MEAVSGRPDAHRPRVHRTPAPVELRVGFLPLVDCAPLVVAKVLGLDERHGVSFVLSRERSWAALRDKLLTGALDLAQALYGLVYGVQMGVAGPRHDLAVLMTLNRNGQGISLSRRLAEQGVVDGPTLSSWLRRASRPLVLAQTFPTGTHAMWLYYWLAAHGIDPRRDVRTIVVPPAQMVAATRAGQIDGFSVGAPWNHIGILDGVSVHVAASQDVWPDHPEKALAARAEFVDRRPQLACAAVRAVMEACRWIDASDENRRATAALIASDDAVAADVRAITGRLLGQYEDGLGRHWQDPHRMCFFDGGDVNFPYLSDGMWFLTQHKRWGLLDTHPDYERVATQVQRVALFREAAAALDIATPAIPLRRSRLVDGSVWDGSDPRGFADGADGAAVAATAAASTPTAAR